LIEYFCFLFADWMIREKKNHKGSHFSSFDIFLSRKLQLLKKKSKKQKMFILIQLNLRIFFRIFIRSLDFLNKKLFNLSTIT